MPSTTSEKNIERLEAIFTTHGLPLSVTSDNRPQFRSDVFERYLEGRGVEHRKTTPLWPQANGFKYSFKTQQWGSMQHGSESCRLKNATCHHCQKNVM